MITEVKFDRWKYVEIETDDWCLHKDKLEIKYIESKFKFNYKIKKLERLNYEVLGTYYEWETNSGFAFKYTQFPIVLTHYLNKGFITKDLYDKYMKEFELNLPEIPQSIGKITLRDDQYEAIKTLMTKRFGICHIFTGYGKTEMIAFMVSYYVKVLGWRVMIAGPNAKVLDEINFRIINKCEITPGYNYPNDSNVILINSQSVAKQSYNHRNEEYRDYLSGVDVILADEVGSDLTPTFLEIYDICINRKCMYGFSATPDSQSRSLEWYKGIDLKYYQNKRLLDIFGGSIVTSIAEKFNIKIVKVLLNNWRITDNYLNSCIDRMRMTQDVSNLPADFRNRLDENILMIPKIAKVLGLLSIEYPQLVVTINRTTIIDYWISKLPELKILEITGRGYRFHFNGNITNLKIDDAKKLYMESNLILGSRSLIMGVDLPNLRNSVQLSGRRSEITIQSIGRTSRGRDMNVIILVPNNYISGYSNHNKNRIDLIYSQYNPELNNITEVNEYKYKDIE